MPDATGNFKGISIPEVPWLKEAASDMTQVATGQRPEIRFDPGPHTYEVFDGKVWRKDFPSVTTITKGTVPMPFSAGQWSGMKMACEGMQALLDSADGYDSVYAWVHDEHLGADELYELLKTTDHRPDRRLKAAGDRGTLIHEAMENWGVSGEVPNPADFDPDDRKLIAGIAKWLGENDPEFVEQEVRTASLAHQYVGTFDAKVRFRAGEWKGKSALLDWKSSKSVYPDSMFPQLEAYREAEREAGFPDVDFAAIVHLPTSGRIKVHPSTDSFQDFKVLRDHYQSVVDRAARVKAAKKKVK